MSKSIEVFCSIAIFLLVAGCVTAGLTPEQDAALREKNGALLAEAQAGQIKWIDYARAANTNYLEAIPTDKSATTQEALAYRIVLAQEVDAKSITPERYDFEWKKFVAERQRESQVQAQMRENAIIASTPQPVTCNTIGSFTTCN